MLGSHGINNIPAFLPSGQFKHIDQYIELVEQETYKPWFLIYLRYIRAISYILLLLWVIFLVVIMFMT
jgi:hypothetical protein